MLTKTILRWPGAKWRLADWICGMFPAHDVYCEPFFGSGAVFFKKAPAGTETVNDIDGEIVNLFRVIRDSADELVKAIEMTPYAREEYRACYGWHGVTSLPRRDDFDEAQADLNALAEKKGWMEYDGK